MRRRHLLIALLLLATPVVGAQESLAGYSRPTDTYVTWHGEPGTVADGRSDRFLTDEDATFELTGSAKRLYIVVAPEDGTGRFRLELRPKTGGRLRVGTYLNAETAPDEDYPGMWMHILGRPCYERGWFELKEYRFAPDGSVKRLWLTFEHECTWEQRPMVTGELKYEIPRDWESHIAAPSQLTWTEWDHKANPVPLPITIKSELTDPDAWSGVENISLRGRNAEAFEIQNENCPTARPDPELTCRIWVDLDSAPPGLKFAYVHLDFATSSSSSLDIPLFARIVPGVTSLTIRNDPQGFGPDDYQYTPRNAFFKVLGWNDQRGELQGIIEGFDDEFSELVFQAPAGERLQEGHTYEFTERYPFNDEGAGASVLLRSYHCGDAGQFTVRKLSFFGDAWLRHKDERLRSAAVGFRTNCGVRGALHYRTIRGDEQPPPRVRHISLKRSFKGLEIDWRNPDPEDLGYVSVRYLQGNNAPLMPGSGLPAEEAGVDWALIKDANFRRAITVAIYPVDSAGNVGLPGTATYQPETAN